MGKSDVDDDVFEEIVAVMKYETDTKELCCQTFDGGLDSVDGSYLWQNKNTEWAKVYED